MLDENVSPAADQLDFRAVGQPLVTLVTLHIILIGVAGTIYNEYTIKLLVNLGLNKHKAKFLAFKLSCHALQRLTTIINTRYALCLQGASGGGGVHWACGVGYQEKESPGVPESGHC
eukprot:931579-Pelagomonas_calceolata.AAC.1